MEAKKPAPIDPFARSPEPPAHVEASVPDMSAVLAGFSPRDIEIEPAAAPMARPNAPDTGSGRRKRRGERETRSQTMNFRLTPTEQYKLNALCDRLDRSMPDTIMLLIAHYERTAGAG